ncbi:MAG: fimbria/pilus periplasmic chaperone [Terracidiphilus sp.]|nr:fimbria/pilus periplasmic chaperone [Terracidiphilus sp.]
MNLGKSIYINPAAVLRLFAAAISLILAAPVSGQMLSVLPVNVFLQPGEHTATLSVTNTSSKPTSIQIRSYEWSQSTGEDQLTPTDAVLASPPLVTIAPAATQVVRLVLRRPVQQSEATYRILLDQIPGPAEPGVVQMVLRLSIPVFALPASRVAPALHAHVEFSEGKWCLVAVNSGQSHEALRELNVVTRSGQKLAADPRVSPYVLAGATRRWVLDAAPDALHIGDPLKLMARGVAGPVGMEIGVVAKP